LASALEKLYKDDLPNKSVSIEVENIEARYRINQDEGIHVFGSVGNSFDPLPIDIDHQWEKSFITKAVSKNKSKNTATRRTKPHLWEPCEPRYFQE